jgi:hypothetical protein
MPARLVLTARQGRDLLARLGSRGRHPSAAVPPVVAKRAPAPPRTLTRHRCGVCDALFVGYGACERHVDNHHGGHARIIAVDLPAYGERP